MLNIIEIFKIVAGLLPALIDFVKAIETALPAQGQGAQKLELLKNTLQGVYAAEQNLTQPFESVWPALSGATSGVVSLLNAVGVFKHG